MTTKREQIAEKIGLALESIKTSNGYRTNIGEKVVYFYEVMDQNVEHIAYADVDEKYEDDNSLRHCELTIDVQVVRYGKNYGQLVNEAVDDVLKALIKTNNRSLGLRDVQIEPTDSTSDYDMTGRAFVVIQLKFKVMYVITI